MRVETRDMPSEILLRIFFEFMTYNTNKAGALIRIALVCRRWRDMTHEYYRFWMELVGLDIPEYFLGELLPRCPKSTVSLTHRARTCLFHEILTAHLYRIDSLDLFIPPSLCIPVINSLNSYAPDLGSLNLKLVEDVDLAPGCDGEGQERASQVQVADNRTLLPAFFEGCAPVLRSVQLSGFTMSLFPAVFRGMNSIELGPWDVLSGPQYPAMALLDALHNAPSLESVVLVDCISDSNLVPDLIADLPNLKRLDLTGFSSAILKFVLTIALPSSCNIKLCCNSSNDYLALWEEFMKRLHFPTTQSLSLTIEIMWGRLLVGLDSNGLRGDLVASFPDYHGDLLVSASTLFPMDRISEIEVRGDNMYNLRPAWSSFLLSWNRVCTLALSGRSAVDLLDPLAHLDTPGGGRPDLSILDLSYVDFGVETGGAPMTLADCLRLCLVQTRRLPLMLIVNACRTTDEALRSVLEHADQGVKLAWDGEEDFSETESAGSEEELEWDGEGESSGSEALMSGEEE